MSSPRLMNFVDDDLIEGAIIQKRGTCGHCGHPTRVICIHKVNLPDGMIPSSSMILYALWVREGHEPELTPINTVGIGCGCYARAHRQIAHIRTTMEARQRGS